MKKQATQATQSSRSPQNREAEPSGLQAMVSRAREGLENERGPAPVEKWNPEFCGELDIFIRRDGTWFYLGSPIGRMPLVRLFSSVLRKDEDGKTYLVTPVEKIGIRVEDAPFLGVEMNLERRNGEPVISIRTNVGDVVEAGKEHPLRFETVPENDGLKPYVLVRGRLEALLSRPVTHELLGHGEEIEIDGKRMFSLRSGGAVFPIMPAEHLDAERLNA